MSYIAAAYKIHCQEAEEVSGAYVSLYERVPFYGGPEEGGWWGEDVALLESQWFADRREAEAVRIKLYDTAKELEKTAQNAHNQQCADEMDWLEERGLEADFLPEVDGPTKYSVYVEERRGQHENQGCRHYE